MRSRPAEEGDHHNEGAASQGEFSPAGHGWNYAPRRSRAASVAERCTSANSQRNSPVPEFFILCPIFGSHDFIHRSSAQRGSLDWPWLYQKAT